jgi:hypothetical protein
MTRAVCGGVTTDEAHNDKRERLGSCILTEHGDLTSQHLVIPCHELKCVTFYSLSARRRKAYGGE